MSKAYPSNLTLAQSELLLGLLPEDKKRGRPRSVSYWEILNAIFYVLCEGCTWRGLPGDFRSLADGLHLLQTLEKRWDLACDSRPPLLPESAILKAAMSHRVN